MGSRLVFVGFFLFLVAAPLSALTLKETLAEVLSTHPAINEKLKNYNATVHLFNKSSKVFKPKLDLQAEVGFENISNSTTRYKTRDSDVNALKLVGKQLVYDGNRSVFDIALRNAMSRSALFELFETANRVAFDTVESYLIVLKAFELVRLAEENVSVHQDILVSIKSRVEYGASGKAERERAQGRLASAQGTLIVRQNDYRRAVYNLQKFLGRMHDGLELEKPELNNDLIPSSLNIALEKMFAEHPTLIAADYNIEQKNQEFGRDQSEFKPYITLEAARNMRGNYNGIDGYDKESTLMVKLSYRLFDGGERDDLLKSSKSLVHVAKQTKDKLSRSLVNDLQLSWTGYKVLESQLGAIRKNILFTSQALASYKEEFKLGYRILINILDAESELQSSRAVFESAKFDFLVAKFRILFSLGTIIQDLGLSIPFSDEFFETKRLRPSGNDTLPPLNDLDGDGIIDDIDISPNSPDLAKVGSYGETEEKTAEFLSEPLRRVNNVGQSIINVSEDLAVNKLKADVPTRIDFVSFQDDSEALTEESKILLRELIDQLKKFSGDGLITLEVVTSEKESDSENYSLSLKRAYHLKKTLTKHNIDPHIIDVKGTAGDRAEGPDRKNYLIVSVITDPIMFTEAFEATDLAEVKFGKGKLDLSDAGKNELKALAKRLMTLEKKQFDLIAYSNDFANAAENHTISLKRLDRLKEILVENGIPDSTLTCIAWGDYEMDSGLKLNKENGNSTNRVEFVIRDL